MLTFLISCHVWFLLICCSESSTVIRFSVPEDHHVRLSCGGSDASDVVWTHRDRRVPVTRQGGIVTNEDPRRYLLLPDGSLRLLQLDESDDGEYHCNQQLVAQLQVLTGRDYTVSAGRTLLLPCSSSSKHRQRWFHRRREGGRREVIFIRFRNGTVRPERDGGGRLSYENDALQIQDLQPEDAGQYECGKLGIRVTVLTVQPEPTSIQQTTWTTATPAGTQTDTVEPKKEKERPENALLIVAVVGLGLMIVLLAAVCVLLTSMKCRRKRKHRSDTASQRRDDTELQPWKTPDGQTERELYESPSLPEEAIHYASLGRQNWRERPGRTPLDQNHHNVIYSSVIPRAAVK